MARPPEDDTFLSRWSRRKRASEEPAAPETEAASAPEPDEALSPEKDGLISEEELATLPAIEDFTPQTDIRPFLRNGVPRNLRNAALRKMWLLTPAIRDHADPAVDYAWDWNTPGGVPGDGAGPTVERAAEMLRDLVAPRRDAENDDALESQEKIKADPPEEAPHSAAPQNIERAPPERGANVEGRAREARQETVETQEKQSDDDISPARKRHGGALPD